MRRILHTTADYLFTAWRIGFAAFRLAVDTIKGDR